MIRNKRHIVAAALALLMAGSTAAAPPVDAVDPIKKAAALRTTAAPIWKEYTRERVAKVAGKTPRYIRTAFRHQAGAVRYTVTGNAGSVSAAGTVVATAPTATQDRAKAAPWAIKRAARLTLRFTWRDGRWQSGPVEWKTDGR